MADTPTPTPPEKQTMWGRIVAATPIALTVLATALAGLSSSEMTQSMYYRSLASQQQSKAGDQWNFFQAKRIRGANMEMTAELMRSISTPASFDSDRLASQCRAMAASLDKPGTETAAARKAAEELAQLLGDSTARTAFSYLGKAKLPAVEIRTIDDPQAAQHLQAVLDHIAQRRPESDTLAEVKRLSPAQIEEAIGKAEASADAFDTACQPTTEIIARLRSAANELSAAVATLPNSAAATEVKAQANAISATIKIAAIDYESRRYRQEAQYNRKVAEIYEVRVRRSGVESDRRRDRSKLFFYGMLLSQAGVTIATLALGRHSKGTLWFLAALAGFAALSYTGYIYVAL